MEAEGRVPVCLGEGTARLDGGGGVRDGEETSARVKVKSGELVLDDL